TDADIKMPYKLPSILQNAGIEYAISLSFSHWNMRNLPFTAGTAVANGLTKEQALQSITLTPAKILRIDNMTGSLESGKEATLLICEGDILDMETSIVERAFIKGREIEIKNWQYENYEKYSTKYGIEIK
ncbi:MAG: amidohydrolase family protein, partial [Fimbriimonadaceae bacterium]|nr:amidohydrolase family protein [Chitinophagales bacterium]